MMSYNIKKYAIIASIILVLCLLVGILAYCSLNSDVANANYYYDNNSSKSVAFPFQQINTIANFNALNFFYGNYTNSNDYVVRYSNDYYYNITRGKIDYTIEVKTGNSMSVNNVDIPFVSHFSSEGSSSDIYTYYQHGCYFDFVANTTYYINFAYNTDVYVASATLPLFYLANGSSWTSLGITYNSIINDIDYMEYNGFVFVSIPFTCSSNYDSFIFTQKFNSCLYYLTITESPSFNSTGFFDVSYSAESDGTMYLDNNFALNTVFVNQDDIFFSNLFNSIDNNNISIFLNASTGSFSNLYFNIKNLNLVSNTLDERCYQSTTYDNTNSYYVVLDLYMYSNQYGNNSLVYNFYDSLGNNIPTITDIDFIFSFANNNVDNYQLGYLAGLADGKEYNHYTYYNAGYTNGYYAGLETADNTSFIGLISAVVEAPLNAIIGIFDFEIFGYNMKNLYLSLLSIALIIFVIKFILGNLGGKGSD